MERRSHLDDQRGDELHGPLVDGAAVNELREHRRVVVGVHHVEEQVHRSDLVPPVGGEVRQRVRGLPLVVQAVVQPPTGGEGYRARGGVHSELLATEPLEGVPVVKGGKGVYGG